MKIKKATKKETPQLVKALRDINRLRAKVGRTKPLTKIPRGTPASADSCPIAVATGLKVQDRWAYDKRDDTKVYQLTKTLSRFVSKFDWLGYPHLVKD
jgi:hypothetical protein